MKVELRVGAAVVSCKTDHRPDPSGKCSENDAARNALFEHLLAVVVEQMRKWMYEPRPETDGGSSAPDDYVRTMEDALKPVLAIEGVIEQAKRKDDRKITCQLDERLFESLDAVAAAQETMRPYTDAAKAAAEVKDKMEVVLK